MGDCLREKQGHAQGIHSKARQVLKGGSEGFGEQQAALKRIFVHD